MLIATLTALYIIFGGGLGHFLVNSDKAIKAAVEDKARCSEILDITKELSKDLKKERKVYFEAVEDCLELHQDYETTSDDFDTQFEKVMEQQQQLIDTTLDARDEMHQRMKADEWHAVFKEHQ